MSLQRTFALLETLANSHVPCRYKDLATQLHPIAPATLSKLLKELCELKVIQEASGNAGYQLTGKLLDLGLKANPSPTLESLCREPMESLNREQRVTVSLMERQGDRLCCLMAFKDDDSPGMTPRSKSRSFAIQAVGALFLYEKSEISKLDIATHLAVDHCKVNPKQMKKIIDLSLKQGYLWDEGEVYAGVGRMAMPLCCAEKKWLLCVGFSPYRLEDPQFKEQLIHHTKATQETIQARLEALWAEET